MDNLLTMFLKQVAVYTVTLALAQTFTFKELTLNHFDQSINVGMSNRLMKAIN